MIADGQYRKPLVSVIVPVYNGEKYLRRCVSSLLVHTYSPLEILLIDDGSRDGSGQICEALGQEDSRIRVFHQENAGPGSARNRGLDHATGEYVAFVDADDYVLPEYIGKMVELSQRYQADIAELAFVIMDSVRNIFPPREPALLILNGREELLREYFSPRRRCNHVVAGRLFRREIIRNLRFRERSIGEDTEFALRTMFHCGRLVKTQDGLYIVRGYNHSTTRRKLSDIQFHTVDIGLQVLRLCEESNVEVESWQYVVNSFSGGYMALLRQMAEERKEDAFPEELKRMEAAWEQAETIARRHNAAQDPELRRIINNAGSWAKDYRRRNRLPLAVKKTRKLISGTAARLKELIRYEYLPKRG